MTSTVAPPSRRSDTSRHTSRRLSGSRPVVGSSRITSSGLPINVHARSTRRVSPPDRASMRTSARCSSDSSASMSSTGRGVVRVALHRRSVSRTVRSPEKPLRWSRTPVRRRRTARSAIGVEPQHADLAVGRRGQPLDHLEGRGLPGAVGAEQRGDRSGRHVEIDPADGLVRRRPLPVGPTQSADPHRGGRRLAGGPGRCRPWDCLSRGHGADDTDRLVSCQDGPSRLAV